LAKTEVGDALRYFERILRSGSALGLPPRTDRHLLLVTAPAGHPGELLPLLLGRAVLWGAASAPVNLPWERTGPGSAKTSCNIAVRVLDRPEAISWTQAHVGVDASRFPATAVFTLATVRPDAGYDGERDALGALARLADTRLYLSWNAERGVAALASEGVFRLIPRGIRARARAHFGKMVVGACPTPFLPIMEVLVDAMDSVLGLGLRDAMGRLVQAKGSAPWWFALSRLRSTLDGPLPKKGKATLETVVRGHLPEGAAGRLLLDGPHWDAILQGVSERLGSWGPRQVPTWQRGGGCSLTRATVPALVSFDTRTPEALPALATVILPPFERDELAGFVRFAASRDTAMATLGLDPTVFGTIGAVALFHGPSGTGKTLAGGAVARALGLPHHTFKVGHALGEDVGEVEKRILAAFEDMRTHPGVFQIDEVDALLLSRDSMDGREGWLQFYTRIVTAFLAFLDTCPNPVILTTNRVRALDPALFRRIHFQVRFPEPDADTRAAIWRALWPTKVSREGIALEAIAQDFPFTGGEIRNVILDACLRSVAQGGPDQRTLLESCLREVVRSRGGNASVKASAAKATPRFDRQRLDRILSLADTLATSEDKGRTDH
jgi:hypothetical protein